MGFPPNVGASMNKAQVLEATGNAYAVPVLGAVLAEVLRTVAGALVSARPARPLGPAGDADGQVPKRLRAAAPAGPEGKASARAPTESKASALA